MTDPTRPFLDCLDSPPSPRLTSLASPRLTSTAFLDALCRPGRAPTGPRLPSRTRPPRTRRALPIPDCLALTRPPDQNLPNPYVPGLPCITLPSKTRLPSRTLPIPDCLPGPFRPRLQRLTLTAFPPRLTVRASTRLTSTALPRKAHSKRDQDFSYIGCQKNSVN